MGMIDDVRKLIQNLVTPDLKAVDAKLSAVDAGSKLRDEALAAALRAVDQQSKMRHEALMATIAAQGASLTAAIAAQGASLAAAIAAVDERSTMRDDALASLIGAMEEQSKMRDDNLSASLASKVELLLARMDAQHSTVMNALAIDKRLEHLERQAKPGESAAA